MNIGRVRRDMEAICAFNHTPGNGYTRFSWSGEDQRAREYLMGQFDLLDLRTSVDSVGNIRARLESEGTLPDAPPVMVGSHIDTVLHGGKFDGLLGTLAALEVTRVIKEEKIPHRHPVEIVIFAEEEGSNFGATTTGSKFFVGRNRLSDMHRLKTQGGVSMYDLVRTFGLDPDAVEPSVKPGDVRVMLEFHIEQSRVLESEGLSVGIVEAVAGVKAFEIVFEGVANHAGATPMNLRNDALVGAAQVALAVERLANESPYPHTVGTVGRITCEPNVGNIIPGRVVFSLDVRDVEEEGMTRMAAEVEKEVKAVAAARGLKHSMRLIGESCPVRILPEVTDVLAACAEEAGLKYRMMNSGAVHDCCLIADVAPVGLIFVPSVGGRSHVPQEDSHWEDIEKGAALLLAATIQFAR